MIKSKRECLKDGVVLICDLCIFLIYLKILDFSCEMIKVFGDYLIKDRIGTGTFGDIYECQLNRLDTILKQN